MSAVTGPETCSPLRNKGLVERGRERTCLLDVGMWVEISAANSFAKLKAYRLETRRREVESSPEILPASHVEVSVLQYVTARAAIQMCVKARL